MSLAAVGPTRERLELAARVRVLRSRGLTHREIAAQLGISRQYAGGLASDPDGSKARARKDSYRGTCERCGGETNGSEGPSRTPRHCAACRKAIEREAKVWTREAVIDAIQRFAALHGRPPTAADWINADKENHYPPRVSVYRTSHHPSSPFASWADAIEAAGFERPRIGKRQRDRSPIVARLVLGDLRRLGEPFRFVDVACLMMKHGGYNNYRVARSYTGSLLRWWRDHGYVARLAPGRYVATDKRYRDEAAA